MSTVADLIAYARTELGKPYVYGNEGPASFDCSGLVQYVFGHVGISLPRTAAAQQAAARTVTTPLPGDLVFYGSPAYHVGIYIGNDQMIDAPHTGTVVQVQSVWGDPTYGRVGGLSAATAPLTQAAGYAVTAGASVLSAAGIEGMAAEALVVALGLTLCGYGVYRAVASKPVARLANQIGGRA